MFITCRNSKCVNYFEYNCCKNLDGETVTLDENGTCEDFKEGTSLHYVMLEESEEKLE